VIFNGTNGAVMVLQWIGGLFAMAKRLVSPNSLPNLPGYDWVTRSSVRHLIFASRSRVASNGALIPCNGLDNANIRIGRNILIDLDEFDVWLDAHRSNKQPSNIPSIYK